MSIPDLVRSNENNSGFWNFEKQNRETVDIHLVNNFYTDGHDKIFKYYGGALSSDTKWFIGYTAVLLHPVTGEIFMRDYGRFTFLLKNMPPNFDRIHRKFTVDGTVDISDMGKEWGHFYGMEDEEEDSLIVKTVFEELHV